MSKGQTVFQREVLYEAGNEKGFVGKSPKVLPVYLVEFLEVSLLTLKNDYYKQALS